MHFNILYTITGKESNVFVSTREQAIHAAFTSPPTSPKPPH